MSEYKLVPVKLLKDWHKRINTIATATAFNVADEMGAMLTAAPVVQGEPTRQYYYKVNSCKALSPDSDQCICWHYEGEGPLADGSAKSWRVAPIKPAEQQPELAKYQPCGCVVCTCEHETQCQGCGAHHCGTHPIGQLYLHATHRKGDQS